MSDDPDSDGKGPGFSLIVHGVAALFGLLVLGAGIAGAIPLWVGLLVAFLIGGGAVLLNYLARGSP